MENLMSNSTCLFAFWFYLKFERQISDNLRYFRYSSIPSVSPKKHKKCRSLSSPPPPTLWPGDWFWTEKWDYDGRARPGPADQCQVSSAGSDQNRSKEYNTRQAPVNKLNFTRKRKVWIDIFTQQVLQSMFKDRLPYFLLLEPRWFNDKPFVLLKQNK